MTNEVVHDPIDAARAVVLYSALGHAVEHVEKQLKFKVEDKMRTSALKTIKAQYEAERARIAAAFPTVA